jgi:hypothetical protein
MRTRELVKIAREIEVLEKRLTALKGEARQILIGSDEAAPPRTRPSTLTAAQRRKISLAMKRRWADLKKRQAAQVR